MSDIKLSDINVGEVSEVLEVGECDLKTRFTDLGIIPGTYIKCVGRSPGKDMKAYLIRGSVIALRSCDCQSIRVSMGESCIWD